MLFRGQHCVALSWLCALALSLIACPARQLLPLTGCFFASCMAHLQLLLHNHLCLNIFISSQREAAAECAVMSAGSWCMCWLQLCIYAPTDFTACAPGERGALIGLLAPNITLLTVAVIVSGSWTSQYHSVLRIVHRGRLFEHCDGVREGRRLVRRH
jgi:hypothetical protein